MDIIRRCVNVVVFAALLAASSGILAVPLYLDRQGELLGRGLPGDRDIWIGVGSSVLALALLFAVTHTTRRKREQYLVYQKDGGPVSISTEAIAEYLGKLVSEFPSIIRLRPRVIPYRHEVDVVAELKVKAGPQIHEVCEMLQRRIRETLASGLGINEIRQVEVSVREIYSEHKPS